MKRQFLLLGMLAIFAACKKTQTSPTGALTGNWQFVKAVGGFTGTQLVSANGKLVYTFNADSTFKQTKNDTLKASGTFHIRTEKSIFTGAMAPNIIFNSTANTSGLLINLKGDTLAFIDNHVEPFTSIYVKVK